MGKGYDKKHPCVSVRLVTPIPPFGLSNSTFICLFFFFSSLAFYDLRIGGYSEGVDVTQLGSIGGPGGLIFLTRDPGVCSGIWVVDVIDLKGSRRSGANEVK